MLWWYIKSAIINFNTWWVKLAHQVCRISGKLWLAFRNGEDPKTGRDAASDRRGPQWDVMGQDHQWPWCTCGSCHPLVHTGTGRCNGALSQTSKTSCDEDTQTRRDAASDRWAPRWDVMGQKRQWPWSTGGSCRPLVHTVTCGLMAHSCGWAKICFHGLFASSCPEFEMPILPTTWVKIVHFTHCACKIDEHTWSWLKVNKIFAKINERSPAWRGNAQLDVVSLIHDVLQENLFTTRLLAACSTTWWLD